MTLDRPHLFIPEPPLIVTKKVHFVYDCTAFVPTRLSGNDTLELCPVRRTHSSPGHQKFHQPAHTQMRTPELQVTQSYFTQLGAEE